MRERNGQTDVLVMTSANREKRVFPKLQLFLEKYAKSATFVSL